MKVGELTTEVRAELVSKKIEVARKVLEKKLSEIDRARAILKKLETDLATIEEMDVEQIDMGGMRY